MKTQLQKWKYFLSSNLQFICLFILIYFAYIALLPTTGGSHDISIFADWTTYIFNHGIGKAYGSGTIYLPLYHYIPFLYGKLFGSAEAIHQNMYYFKLIPLTFDFIAGFCLIKYINSTINNLNHSINLSLFYFLNIAYLYNTLIWGQIDSINACLVFLAYLFALKQKIFTSLFIIFLAINFKLVSIIFFPLIFFILLPAIIDQFSLKKIIAWTLILLALQCLIFLPFFLAGELNNALFVIKNADGYFPYVSYNAFNFWHWVLDNAVIPDNIRLWNIRGLTYKHIGTGLFFASSFIALFPLLNIAFNKILHKKNNYIHPEKLLIIAALTPLLFFFFNTQMHERYSHMSFIFLAAYSLSTGKYFPYILGSAAYCLNLDILGYLPINHNLFIFNNRFIALLYFISIIYLFLQLYEIKLFHKKPAKIIPSQECNQG